MSARGSFRLTLNDRQRLALARDERRRFAPAVPPLRRWWWRRAIEGLAWVAYAAAWGYLLWMALDSVWGGR